MAGPLQRLQALESRILADCAVLGTAAPASSSKLDSQIRELLSAMRMELLNLARIQHRIIIYLMYLCFMSSIKIVCFFAGGRGARGGQPGGGDGRID